jgi:hypothetical protein
VKYDVGGTRPENDLSDKVVVTKTMKLKPAATRAAAEAATRAGEPLPYEFTDNYTITVPAVADAPKRTYIDAWVYITSFDGPGGTDSIRVRRYAGGDASKILYLAADGKLQAGITGTVTQSNILFFKGGGVIGLTGSVDDDPYGTNDIKFNPSAVILTADWATIPRYEGSDWPAIKNVSDPAYVTLENLKKGKGDPCMLVGYDAATIKGWDQTAFDTAMAAAQWRLPTDLESNSFVGGPALPIMPATVPYWRDFTIADQRYQFMVSAGTANQYTYPTGATSTAPKYNNFTTGTPPIAKFPLVAQGTLTAGAYSIMGQGYLSWRNGTYINNVRGHYWTSAVNNTSQAYFMLFDSLYIASYVADASYGFGVRCVAK